MKKSSRVISTLLLGATLTTFSTGVFAVESQKVVKEKLAGANRYETNLAVSAKWEKADTVVLVQGYAIPDALAATPLAKQKDAPILLTETDKLTKSTADEIKRLGATNAIIVGGEGVVSKDVEKDLEAMNVKVTRLAGQSRFETSEAVVKEMGEVSKVAVVNGYGESDALSIAAPAAKNGMAIVLAGKDELKGSADVVKNAKEKYVIGGEGVVSEKLEKEIGAERLGGATRNETNAAILDKFYSEKEIENLYVAKDGNPITTELVDALGVGPLAGKEGNPVMLAGAKASAGQLSYLKDKTAKKVTEVGNGVNATTLADIVKALEVKDVTPEPDKAEITGVKVLNANQIEVNFNQKVDKDSAENIDNYTEMKIDSDGRDLLAEARKELAGNDNKDIKGGKAEVQEDGRTVIVTFDQGYTEKYENFKVNQETLKVKIENIMTENKSDVFAKYENKNVKMFDNTLPELKEIKQVGPKHFDLIFSEPVTAANNSEMLAAMRINDGAYNFNAETRIENSDLDSNVIRIKTSTELKDGQYDFEIKENKLVDYSGLKVEVAKTKLNVKKDETALTASVYKVNGKKATLKFNKEIENAEHYFYENGNKNVPVAESQTTKEEGNENVSYYLDYANNDEFKAWSAKMVDGKLEVQFDKPIPTGTHKIVVVYDDENEDKVQDLWEQELSNKEISFDVAKDTIAPTATVSYDKKDKNVIEVKFSEEVEDTTNSSNKGAMDLAAYELKDSKGNYVTINEIEKKNENKLVYRLFVEKPLDGKYSLKIKKNKIYDTSVERNVLKEITFDLATLDQTPADVTSVRWGGKDTDKIYVEFSEEMRTEGEGNILDKKLYDITYTEKGASKAKTKNLDDIDDAQIKLNSKSSVIITLPEKGEAEKASVQVGRVCDANGNFAGVGGTNTAVSKPDATVEKLTGNLLDEKNTLDNDENKQFGANVIADNKIELYLRGGMIAADASKITLKDGQFNKDTEDEDDTKDLICSEVSRDVVILTEKDGKDIVATKLTLKFDDNTFTTDGKLATKKIDSDKIKLNLDKGALTTTLDTESADNTELDLNLDDKASADYLDKSAVLFKDDENIAKKIEFKLTEPVKSVTKDTFEVEGFEVENAKFANNDNAHVILEVKERQFTDNKADIKVKQVKDLYDIKDNKTTGLSFTVKPVDGTLVSEKQAEVNAEAAKITIKAPAKDATTLTLPTVEGYTVVIKSSSDENVIAKDGTITQPTDDTDVKLKLTLTNIKSKKTADTAEITVKVLGKTVKLSNATVVELKDSTNTLTVTAVDADVHKITVVNTKTIGDLKAAIKVEKGTFKVFADNTCETEVTTDSEAVTNTMVVKAIAEDGTTTQVYTIVVE